MQSGSSFEPKNRNKQKTGNNRVFGRLSKISIRWHHNPACQVFASGLLMASLNYTGYFLPWALKNREEQCRIQKPSTDSFVVGFVYITA